MAKIAEERQTKNPDLKRERDRASFDPELLACILYGPEQLKRKRYIGKSTGTPFSISWIIHKPFLYFFVENLALSCPEFNAPYYGFIPVEDRYGESVRQEAVLARKLKELNLTNARDVNIFTNTALNMDGSALSLHRLAFVPPVLSQGSKEQVEKWKPLIDSGEMLGSYAQTELGHGKCVKI